MNKLPLKLRKFGIRTYQRSIVLVYTNVTLFWKSQTFYFDFHYVLQLPLQSTECTIRCSMHTIGTYYSVIALVELWPSCSLYQLWKGFWVRLARTACGLLQNATVFLAYSIRYAILICTCIAYHVHIQNMFVLV